MEKSILDHTNQLSEYFGTSTSDENTKFNGSNQSPMGYTSGHLSPSNVPIDQLQSKKKIIRNPFSSQRRKRSEPEQSFNHTLQRSTGTN